MLARGWEYMAKVTTVEKMLLKHTNYIDQWRISRPRADQWNKIAITLHPIRIKMLTEIYLFLIN